MDNQTETRTRTVTWDDPFTVMRAAPGRTGIELLQEIVDKRLPPAPITVTLDFAIVEVSEGRAVFRGMPGEYMYNPIGSVHGGYAMTLLDSAMACAIHTTLGAGETYTTLEVKVNFIRPLSVDTGPVRCEGTLLHRGDRIATSEGKLFAERTGKLLAHGSTTCLVMRA